MYEIINKIKSYKKYKTISNVIIIEELEHYFKKYPDLKERKLKKSEQKKIIKEIRKKLHRIYSSYQIRKKKDIKRLLNELKNILEQSQINKKAILSITNGLLSTTLSTKERLPYYKYIYGKIFKLTGKPKTIVDLGAGLNPFSYPYMKLSSLKYYSYDIDISDCNLLNNYFSIMNSVGLKGSAKINNINTIEVDNLPQPDIVFLFKVIDLIDEKNKKKSKELIKNLIEKNKTRFIVASFSTKTLTRKPMNLSRRIGFEKILKSMNLKFKDFSIENEIFYVIWKDLIL